MEHSYRYRLRFGTQSGCQNFRASFQGFSTTSKQRTEAYRMHVGTDFLKLPPVTGQYWSLFQCSMLGTGGTCVVDTQNMSRLRSMGPTVDWWTLKFAPLVQGCHIRPRAAPHHPPLGDLGPGLGHQHPTPLQRGRLHGLSLTDLTHTLSPRTQHRPPALKALDVSRRSACHPCSNTPKHTCPRDKPRPRVRPRLQGTPPNK